MRNAIARAGCSMPHRHEHRLDGVCGSQVLSVFSGKVIRYERLVAIHGELLSRLWIPDRIELNEAIEGIKRVFTAGCQIRASRLSLGCTSI